MGGKGKEKVRWIKLHSYSDVFKAHRMFLYVVMFEWNKHGIGISFGNTPVKGMFHKKLSFYVLLTPPRVMRTGG